MKAARQQTALQWLLLGIVMTVGLFLRGQAEALQQPTSQQFNNTPAVTLPAVQASDGFARDATVEQTLLARVQTSGRISVIVGFAAPYSPLAAGDRASDAAQQVGIDSIRNNLLASLGGTGNAQVISDSHTWSIPFVALDVDEAAYRALLASPQVTSIRENMLMDALLTSSIPVIEADDVWGLGFNGAGQTVAVLDTGVDGTHPAFAGKLVAEACYSGAEGSTTLCPNLSNTQTGPGAASPARCDSLFTGMDDCFHGTHVAGIAAGSDPVRGIYGVARSANIIAVQVFTKVSGFNDAKTIASDQIAGLNYVYSLRFTYNIAAVNMSIGGGEYTGTCDTVNPAMTSMFNTLRTAGIMPVVASGNGASTNSISHPACISHAVSVSASTDWDTRANFADVLQPITSLFAPGQKIYAPVPSGSYFDDGTDYGFLEGTSMAAPHVAGAFALLRSAVPGATTAQILTALRNTGVPISVPGGTVPRINVRLAYLQLTGAVMPTSTPITPPPSIPANDQASGAYPITGLPYTTTQNDVYYATMTNDPPGFCSLPLQNIVWYRYAQFSGSTRQIVLDTFGSTYDTVLGVFTAGGTSVVCNDDFNAAIGIDQSQVTLNAVSGMTYYIGIGKVDFNVQFDDRLTLHAYDPTIPTSTPSPTPGSSMLIIQVGLQGRPTAPHAKWVVPLRVIVRQSGSGTIVYDSTVMTNTSGSVTITGLTNGTYHVWVKHAHTLARSAVFVIIGYGTQNFGTLLEGDADNNNAVSLTDFSLLAASFGKSLGQAGYDARADFNGDDAVTLADFSLLASNFNQAGAP